MIYHINTENNKAFITEVLNRLEEIVNISDPYADIVNFIKSKKVEIHLIKFELERSYGFMIKYTDKNRNPYAVSSHPLHTVLSKLIYYILETHYGVSKDKIKTDLLYFLDREIFKLYIKNNLVDIIKMLVWRYIKETKFYSCLNSKLDKLIKVYVDDDNNIIDHCLVRIYNIEDDTEANLSISCNIPINEKTIDEFAYFTYYKYPIESDNVFCILFDNTLCAIDAYLQEYLDSGIINGYIFVDQIFNRDVWIPDYEERKKSIIQLIISTSVY